MQTNAIILRLILLLLFVSLVVTRLPIVTLQGRFWAEDGSLYFHNARLLPWWQAAFRPQNGYLSLIANLSGILANALVPLDRAPLVTEILALFVQMLPAIILLTSRDMWLRTAPIVSATILLIAMPPLCDEVWLNTANSQFHVALAAALCVSLDAPAGWSGRGRNILLCLAPLCSPVSIALAPVFVLRAAWERQRARTLQAACFLAGMLPQLLAMLSSPLHDRGKLIGPVTMACVLAAKHLALPFLGEDSAEDLVPTWFASVHAGRVPYLPVLTVVAVAAVIILAAARTRRPETICFLASGIMLVLASYNAAVGGGISLITVDGGQRYAFAASMLFALTAVSLCTATNRSIAYGARLVAIWLLAVSIWQTVRPQDQVYASGPAWRQEVTKFRADPAYMPQIWPVGWKMRLR